MTRRRPLGPLLTSLGILALLCPAPTLARPKKPAPPPAAPAPPTAAQLGREGETKFRAGDFEGALALFREAQAALEDTKNAAALQWNIARCLEKLERPKDAITEFRAYIDLEESAGRKEQAKERIAELERLIFGSVEVICDRDVEVALAKGSEKPKPCPALFEHLEAGPHRIIATLKGREYPPQEAQIVAGQKIELEFPRAARLTVTATVDDATAYLDGKALGAVPIGPVAVPPGEHLLEVASIQHGEWKKELALAPRSSVELEAPLETPSTVWPWVATGAAVAAAGAGTAFLFLSNQSVADQEDAQARYDAARTPLDAVTARNDFTTAEDQANQRRLIALVGLGTSAAFAGLATWLFLDRDEAPSSGPAPSPEAPAAWRWSW